jgi:predicted nucleic acid-binding protein
VIVVDTNVIAYLFLNGDHSKASERLLQRDSDWVAPRLWRSEFRNVLALYLRKALLDFRESMEIAEAAERLMSGAEYEVPSALVLQLVGDSGCSAYDCEFVALARFLGVPLATRDRSLQRAFPQTAIGVERFLEP